MVKTRITLKLKSLGLDNGGDYYYGSFKEYYAAYGINMKKIILKTHNKWCHLAYD